MDERQKKREELKKKYKKGKDNKCKNCIWGSEENNYCMFSKCFNELDERRKNEP